MEKKCILIIEDIDEHFKSIKSILESNNYVVIPPFITDESSVSNEDFIKEIRTKYDTAILDEIRDKSKCKIKDLLLNQNIDGFIIDYELEQSKRYCTGVSFYNNFIKGETVLSGKPVLFLSGKRGNPIQKVINQIERINNNNDSTIAFFMSKDRFNNSQFLEDLENKINEIFMDKPQMPKS